MLQGSDGMSPSSNVDEWGDNWVAAVNLALGSKFEIGHNVLKVVEAGLCIVSNEILTFAVLQLTRRISYRIIRVLILSSRKSMR
jgi:hypothetical protein